METLGVFILILAVTGAIADHWHDKQEEKRTIRRRLLNAKAKR